MKKTSIVLGLLLVISSVSFAQRPEMDREDMVADPAKRVETVTNRMKEALGLNDDQYEKVLSLNKTRSEKMKTKRDEMKIFHETEKVDYDRSLKDILTLEQYTKFQENMTEKRKKSENCKSKDNRKSKRR